MPRGFPKKKEIKIGDQVKFWVMENGKLTYFPAWLIRKELTAERWHINIQHVGMIRSRVAGQSDEPQEGFWTKLDVEIEEELEEELADVANG